MKTNKEQLINLLCEVEEVKKDIMELKFWCKLKDLFLGKEDTFVCFIWNINCIKTVNVRWPHHFDKLEPFESRFSILWNPLDYHHLMMYCHKKMKGWYVDFQVNWILNCRKWETNWVIIQLELKPLSKQTEEVYKSILDFLKK